MYVFKSLTSEVTRLATQFFKRAYKIGILSDYKHSGLLCLAFPPRQKSGLILVKKWLKLPRNHSNKKCAPEFLFFNEKIIQKDSGDF